MVYNIYRFLILYLVVIQSYEAEADNEYVIRGNSAVMKCEYPSYVADFVFVDLWTDSAGGTYYPGNEQEAGTKAKQFFFCPLIFRASIISF